MSARLTICSALFLSAAAASNLYAGPKGDVTVRGVARGSITVDGSFSDWPLDQFTAVSQQPEFPVGKNEFTTDADGDHLVYDPDRVGYFNGTDPAELEKDGLSDFGVANYVNAADRDALLGIANRLNGDADFDGNVGFPDFLALSSNFGQNGLWSQGDFDTSGDVQFPDFLILSSSFGQSAPAAAIPEPGAIPLILWGALGMLCRRTRR